MSFLQTQMLLKLQLHLLLKRDFLFVYVIKYISISCFLMQTLLALNYNIKQSRRLL